LDYYGYAVSYGASSLPSWLTLTNGAGQSGIETVCGTGPSTGGQVRPSGDGGPATNAVFGACASIAFDRQGNYYFADSYSHAVRRVDPSGIITTVAGGRTNASGQGLYGYSGDDGPATNALLNTPFGVALDAAGNLYIADSENHKIRRVSTNGIITTFAGRTETSSWGSVVGGYSGDGGPATNAQFFRPSGLALDRSGNLYVADSGNHLIRQIATNGVVTLYGGQYVTSGGVPQGGCSGDGGAATSARFNQPAQLACDTSTNLFVQDYGNRRVRRIGANGIVATVAGNGLQEEANTDGQPATEAGIGEVRAMGLDGNGTVHFATGTQGLGNRVRKVGADGRLATVAGHYPTGNEAYFSGDGGAATNATFADINAIAFNAQSDLFIGDIGRVRKVTDPANTWRLIGTPGPAQAGTSTNIRVLATSVSGSTPQDFTIAIAGRARPLVKNAALAAVSNGVAASSALGTDFGSVDTFKTLDLSLTNFGTAALQISGVTTSGSAYFSLSNLPTTVAAGTASNFSIIYQPVGLGAHQASFVLTHNGTNSPYVINVAGSGILPGEISLNRSLMSYTATYGGSNPAAQTLVISNKGPGTLTSYTNADNAAWFTLGPVTGGLAAGATRVHTGTVSIAGLNAGAYYATNTVSSAFASNSPVSVLIQLTLNQATQAITFAAIPAQKITNTVRLSATASSGLPVAFSVASGPGVISGGTNLTFTDEGTVWVVASQTGNVNFAAAPSRTNSVVVTKLSATVTLTNLTQTYDGTAKQVSYTTAAVRCRWRRAVTRFWRGSATRTIPARPPAPWSSRRRARPSRSRPFRTRPSPTWWAWRPRRPPAIRSSSRSSTVPV
jgi:hypothetical protein